MTVKVGDALGAADRTVGVNVKLHTSGQTVAAVQNDIGFEPDAAIVATASGDPACRVNPAINKNDSAFAFQPAGCEPGVDCTGVRAVVFSMANVDPIPEGSELYGCAVHISPTAAAGDSYPLVCSNGGASTPGSQPVPVLCRDGSVSVRPVCIGDCAQDGQVTIDDLVKGVKVLLGLLPLEDCSTLDRNLDGKVTIDELVQAVKNALTACVAVPLG